MAATAAYVAVSRISEGGPTAGETVAFSNISATTAPFKLTGGKYAVDVVASTFGTVTLQRLAPDGSTWLAALTAFSANGTANADLPPGSYKVVLA